MAQMGKPSPPGVASTMLSPGVLVVPLLSVAVDSVTSSFVLVVELAGPGASSVVDDTTPLVVVPPLLVDNVLPAGSNMIGPSTRHDGAERTPSLEHGASTPS